MTAPYWTGDDVTVHHGDCLTVLTTMADNTIDAIVCDPPYELAFMSKRWDATGVAFNPAMWAECLRVLKPGGHCLAFGGTRTWHRLACAVEDAGFEIRDSLAWLTGSGFPKSRNVSRDLDDVRCQCEAVPYNHANDRDPLRGMRSAVHGLAEDVEAGQESDVLQAVQRGSARSRVGAARLQRGVSPENIHANVRPGQSSMERRSDLQAAEGELHRTAVHPVPTGPAGDGTVGRVRDGAQASDGPLDRPAANAPRSGQPQGSQPPEQRPVEPGVVPNERGSQARRSGPVCGRCGKPSIPGGLGTALKPAFEPVVVSRKPLAGMTVAQCVTTWGTGALNIDGCRIGTDVLPAQTAGQARIGTFERGVMVTPERTGRWPANVVLDESQAAVLDKQSGTFAGVAGGMRQVEGAVTFTVGEPINPKKFEQGVPDFGGASRFFKVFPTFRYCAKAPTTERPNQNGIAHATVKPLELIQYLVRLVTPPGGTVLDPFAGSGTTGEAALREGFKTILIEKETDYLPLILERFRRPINYIMNFNGDDAA